MRCPYCESSVAADAPECSACQLTFPKTSALFGASPRTDREVYDSTHQLTAAQKNTLYRHIFRIRRKYPQLYPQVFLHAFPPPHPLRTHAFWLFNAAAFSGDVLRGSNNHTLLIVIDPVRMESAIMPGYGLESLLDERLLGALLDAADPFWKSGDWTGGILCLLDRLDGHLEGLTEPYALSIQLPPDF